MSHLMTCACAEYASFCALVIAACSELDASRSRPCGPWTAAVLGLRARACAGPGGSVPREEQPTAAAMLAAADLRKCDSA